MFFLLLNFKLTKFIAPVWEPSPSIQFLFAWKKKMHCQNGNELFFSILFSPFTVFTSPCWDPTPLIVFSIAWDWKICQALYKFNFSTCGHLPHYWLQFDDLVLQQCFYKPENKETVSECKWVNFDMFNTLQYC